MKWHRLIVLTLCLGAAASGSTALEEATADAVAGVPERAACGQTLVVPAATRELGEVYYVIAGAGTQFTWQTDAPLLRQVATCNRVVGYLVAPFDLEEGQPPILAGALRLPVASLTTGYEQADAGLHAADGFDRENHPEILLSVTGAGPARSVTREHNQERGEFDLAGKLTIKGKTVPFESPARIALLPFTGPTQIFSPSDLLMLRTSFKVSLENAGMATASPIGPGFAGSEADVEFFLMATTIHPSQNFDPRVPTEMYVKQLQFMTRLRDFQDPVDAYVYGRAYMKEIWDDGRMLNDLALNVLTDEGVNRRDLEFVEKAARRANELTEYKDPQYLNTLARACYERGDLDAAVRWSRKAVENLEGQPFFIPPPIQAALAAYEAEAESRVERSGSSEGD
jgi:hypothetical protein